MQTACLRAFVWPQPTCDREAGPRAAAGQAVAATDVELLPCGRPAAANYWRIVPIPRDGHCGYRAVLTDGPGDMVSDLAVRALRNHVAEYLASELSADQHDTLQGAHTDVVGYLHSISPGSEYADGDAIQVMARALKRRIIMLEATPDGRMTEVLNAVTTPANSCRWSWRKP